jgi:hyperosmotically inducible periplasmic protein
MKKNFGRLMAIALLSIMFISAVTSCKSKVKDEDIQTTLDSKLSAVPDLSTIKGTVKDGVVTLSGECRDESLKTSAENMARSIPGVLSVVDNCTVSAPPPAPAPVVVAEDDLLTRSVADALKDYPGVRAAVKDGVITLTGEIKRSNLTKLMQTLHTLKPKKIDNQLTIK